jgi:hypothetical protein
VDCLVNQGFERNPVYPDTFSQGEVALDIRTRILWGDRIKSRNNLIKIDQTRIFNDSRPINAENPAVRCLGPSDQCLYLSLHAMKHNLERLIWMVDIQYLVADWTSSDWRRLMDRAEELGQEAALYCLLFLLKQIYDVKLPADSADKIDGFCSNFFVRRILNRRIKGRSIPTWSQLMLMSAGTGLLEKTVFVGETLFPRPAVLRQVFPNSEKQSDGRLYWKRARQIIGSIRARQN